MAWSKKIKKVYKKKRNFGNGTHQSLQCLYFPWKSNSKETFLELLKAVFNSGLVSFDSFWVDPWSKGNDLGNSRVWLGGSQGSAWKQLLPSVPRPIPAAENIWDGGSRAGVRLSFLGLIIGEGLGLNSSWPRRGAGQKWAFPSLEFKNGDCLPLRRQGVMGKVKPENQGLKMEIQAVAASPFTHPGV